MDGVHQQQRVTRQACFDQAGFPSLQSTFPILPMGKALLVSTTPNSRHWKAPGSNFPHPKTVIISSADEAQWKSLKGISALRLRTESVGVFVRVSLFQLWILFTRNAGAPHGIIIKASMVWVSVLPAVCECVSCWKGFRSAVCLQERTKNLMWKQCSCLEHLPWLKLVFCFVLLFYRAVGSGIMLIGMQILSSVVSSSSTNT